MKVVRTIVKVALGIAGIVLVLLLALPLWIGPVVKTVSQAIVPKKTGTAFHLGQFGLNPYDGKLSVGDMQLFNPEDFSQKMAVTVGTLDVAVDPMSLAGDVIVVQDVVLKDVFVSYVSNSRGENNFTIIKRNVNGGSAPTKVTPANVPETARAKDGAHGAEPSPAAKSTGAAAEKPAKKVVVDHLLLDNVMVQFGPISLPLPKIELTGIGRKSNGVTWSEAWTQIETQVMQSFNAMGVKLDDLIGGIKDVKVDKALKVIDAVRKGNAKDVADVVNATLSGLNKATGKTTETVGGATTKAVDVTKEGVDKSVEKVNEHIEKAAETIKSLKSLF